MLEFLKPLKDKDSDCITFIKGEEEDSISVMGRNYVDPGEPIGGSEMGHNYHIILVKDHAIDPDKFDHFDSFEAILICPLEYISRLINEGWYGIVAKKTTTSHLYVDKVLANMDKLL